MSKKDVTTETDQVVESTIEESVATEEVVADEEAIGAPSDATPEENEMYALFHQFMKLATKNSPKVTLASPEEWKALNKSEHIITSGAELKAETKATKFQSDIEKLIASSKSGRILNGTIIGIRSTNSDNGIATWVAEVQFGNDTCTVLIPSYMLYHYDITKYTNPGQERIIHKTMEDMIGADIGFVVRHVDKAKKIAYASRLQALEKEARDNYIRQTRTGKPRAYVGGFVEAKVLAVRNNHIIVNALGSDTIIPAKTTDNRIAWEFVNDCHSLFSVNDVIAVKILAVKEEKVDKYNDTYTLVATKLSHKETLDNPLDQYWDTIQEGEIGTAVVTAISNGNVYCKYKNRVSILCKSPDRGTEPYIGQKRNVRITLKKDEPGEGKRIFGVFASL